ncbi:N-acetylmuramic acid 6-phosphate etherase [Psychroflexus planctonicus]|uniref:N-acetylmuramic acid 6-phosphate etherase n=1 Tax=Psychroflexus planctonicus TaxID=1526575 RepID=A0ABQ1SK80_9FLAO|nr:N-acetylmuramic acid 6-phosphate etherase [Psychroflexus planctonicus]GGE44039.1 N-acetylmuramic acid 6-phosphate etherase [Psychroflexus planctonicus]
MEDFEKTTEQDSLYNNLEQMEVSECLQAINQEDQKVAIAVKKVIPQIEALLKAAVKQLKLGGRLFYIGAGTSGRLGILDASECPPTFGVPAELVTGIIAGGDQAIRKAVEKAEDNQQQAWKDLTTHQISEKDVVIGIAASGTTPYVVGGIKDAKKHGIITGCITCNLNSPLANAAQFPIEVNVGPEFVTGSSRMKAGTAQKMILNMISTTAMVQLGKVKGNKMVDMQLSNEKLNKRAIEMLVNLKNVDAQEAKNLLQKHGSVRKALENE